MTVSPEYLYPRREMSPDAQVRVNTVHLFGISILDRNAIMKVFGSHSSKITSVEFLDDSSCNVVFGDERDVFEAVLSLTGTALTPDGQWQTYTVPRSITQPIINSGVYVKDTSMQVSLMLRVASEGDIKNEGHKGGRDSLFYEKQRLASQKESRKRPLAELPKIGCRGFLDPLLYLRAGCLPSAPVKPAVPVKPIPDNEKSNRLPSVIYRICQNHNLPYKVLPLKRIFKSIKFSNPESDPWDLYCSENLIDCAELLHVLYFRTDSGRLVTIAPHSVGGRKGIVEVEKKFPGATAFKLAAMSKELNLPVFVCPPFGHKEYAKGCELGEIVVAVDSKVFESKKFAVFDLGFVAVRFPLSDLARVGKELGWLIVADLWNEDLTEQ